MREREALERYLDQMEKADERAGDNHRQLCGDAAALEKLRQHPEPEARFMRTAEAKLPPTTCRPPWMPSMR